MEKRLSSWKRELLRAHGLIADLFVRSESRALSLAYLQGLLSGCERKNGWQLAEWMEEAAPYRVQHLLDRACWDADAARDRLRDYVLEQLSSPDAVLIVDETGFLKKGRHSAGVERQYSGTAGRIENSQVGVFLCYGSDRGAALVDRELYIPPEWAEDGWARALLVRRSIEEKPVCAYYLCYAPTGKDTLETLVRAAGRRWLIEQSFETAKGECGLDHYEVRHWQG